MPRLLALLCLILLPFPAFAEESHTITLQILPLEPFRAGHEQHAIAKLTHIIDGSPVTADELMVAHTKKFHLLIVDEALEDFQHIHPDIRDLAHTDCPKWDSCNPGEYPFSWTPHERDRHYRAWADLTPVATSKQEYAMADMPGTPPAQKQKIRTYDAVQTLAGHRFTLTFDAPPAAGRAVMATLHMTDARGKSLCSGDDDCRTLSPVMGAYAHMVGFNEDFETVLHAHPMGGEPKDDDARGGPDVMFHLMPPKAGLYNIFIQIKPGEETLFIPFSVRVDDTEPAIKNP